MYILKSLTSLIFFTISIYSIKSEYQDYFYITTILGLYFFIDTHIEVYNKFKKCNSEIKTLKENLEKKSYHNFYSNSDEMTQKQKIRKFLEKDSFQNQSSNNFDTLQQLSTLNDDIENKLYHLQFDILDQQNKNILYSDVVELENKLSEYVKKNKKYELCMKLIHNFENMENIKKYILNILIHYNSIECDDILIKIINILEKKSN